MSDVYDYDVSSVCLVIAGEFNKRKAFNAAFPIRKLRSREVSQERKSREKKERPNRRLHWTCKHLFISIDKVNQTNFIAQGLT